MKKKEFYEKFEKLTVEEQFDLILDEIGYAEEVAWIEGKDLEDYSLEDKIIFVNNNWCIFGQHEIDLLWNNNEVYDYPEI